MKASIRVKALLLLLVFAVGPLVGLVLTILPTYGATVQDAEERRLIIVTTDLGHVTEGEVTRVEEEARAIANVLGHTAKTKQPGAVTTAALQSVLQAAEIDAVRFEIPSKSFETLINKEGADTAKVPRSDEASRQMARNNGISVSFIDPDRAALVVPVPRASDSAPQGYVVAPVYLRALKMALERSAGTHLDGARIMVVDSRRRVLAQYHVPGLKPGDDASEHPALGRLEGEGIGSRAAIKSEFNSDEGAMVGLITWAPSAGWAVAVWRPRADAYAAYNNTRRLMIGVVVIVALLAMIVGFISARTVTQPVLQIRQQAELIGQRRWGDLQQPSKRGDELGDLDRAVRKMATDLQTSEQELQKELQLRGDLSRFMSQEVVEGIVKGEHPLELGGQRAEITVLFADMVAFTSAAETRPPEVVVAMLNELFTVMTEVVFRHGGTVDKFIGDCIMGVWGAPISDPEHALHALEAAEDMMSFLETASEQWREKYGVEVRLAIGVNSGEAIVGNIGSSKRMEYTVVGDVVNVAGRLETIAAPNQILVGANTHEMVEDDFELRLLGERQLTGRAEAIKVYELQTD